MRSNEGWVIIQYNGGDTLIEKFCRDEYERLHLVGDVGEQFSNGWMGVTQIGLCQGYGWGIASRFCDTREEAFDYLLSLTQNPNSRLVGRFY